LVRLNHRKSFWKRAATATAPQCIYGAINKIVGIKSELDDYSLSREEGEDALGEAVDRSGREKFYTAPLYRVIEASIKAYINGINKIVGDSEP
jgi:hypothetical protein